MTKSGVFEVPDKNYDSIVKLYNHFKPLLGADQFETFCGDLLLKGQIVFCEEVTKARAEGKI